jgi:hypothetical protein
VAAASSRAARQRALVRERTRDKRRSRGRKRRIGWLSSAEIAAQPMISAD